MKNLIKRIISKDTTIISSLLSMFFYSIVSRLRLKRKNILDFKYLNYNEFSNNDNKTIFLLGSGSSINKLSEQNYELIKKNFSIGINRWVLHNFIPNLYSFEYSSSNMETVNLINNFLESDKIAINNPIILFNESVINRETGKNYCLKKDYYKNVRIYSTTRIPAWNEAKFHKILNFILSSFGLKFIPNGTLLGKRASIERMTYLAIKLGFKRIVYLGVDLNNTSYFWEQDNELLNKYSLSNYKSGQTGVIHKTELPSNSIPVSSIIKIISKVVKKQNIELMVGNKDSKLSEFLPVFNWE